MISCTNLPNPMKHLLLCLTLLCLLVAGVTPANAARHRKIVKTESTITAVSGHSISVKTGSAHHTYKISSQTAIHLNGAKASAKDLKKGMHAEITASQLAPGAASAIEASSGS